MTLTRLELANFTAFEHLDLELSPGVNVFIGANGTGKTHLLKVLYAACEATRGDVDFEDKLVRVFLPWANHFGRLIRRQADVGHCGIGVYSDDRFLRASFRSDQMEPGLVESLRDGVLDWRSERLASVYIPVKEMLANAPGFRSQYALRETHFEEVYADILDRAYLPPLRSNADPDRARLLDRLQGVLGGQVVDEGEEFFLAGGEGLKLEFTLLAEGYRKLGLLYRLIQNGTLAGGSILFWDEPEANLNPSMMGTVVDILLELQRMGVQVFLATHDYVTLKQFDLRSKPENRVLYHALYRENESSGVAVNSTEDYLQIHPNAISDTFADLYDADVKRALALGGEKE